MGVPRKLKVPGASFKWSPFRPEVVWAATVFRCHDPTLDRHVAVKVLPSFHTEDPTFTERFAQEAQTVARLTHPNILQIYDFGEDKGFTYIVSELVPGGDLQDVLTNEPMQVKEIMKYMAPLAGALDYAHGQGIIHRDLKPANVLLDDERRPILADFGLARMLESATRFTQASQALGTPEYMAPEQAMGADADHRSDLYAFGIMVYQLLLGVCPRIRSWRRKPSRNNLLTVIWTLSWSN